MSSLDLVRGEPQGGLKKEVFNLKIKSVQTHRRRSADNALIPVLAEHAFPLTQAVDSLRAYLLPVQPPHRPLGAPPSAVLPSAGAAFGGGPRFARGTGLNSASGLTLQASILGKRIRLPKWSTI